MSEETKKLGKMEPKKDSRLLRLSNFADTTKEAPKKSFFWKKRVGFPQRSFGNTMYGNCTRASQALAAMRMERLETRKTITITDDEIIRVYFQETQDLYGGGDTGAYEMDSLNYWRREDKTFRDTKGRAYTIDAYTAVNFRDINEVKNAIALSGAHGIKVCLNLPYAYAMQQDLNWDVPEGQPLNGIWTPGSWGGHCCGGDTIISLLNGKNIPIRELAESKMENFWVYGSNEKGEFVPCMATKAVMTKIAKTLTITLDNGETIKCTPEHLFMLRDGSYIEAKNLISGTSLMPLYKRFKQIRGNDYEQISLGGTYEFTHKLMANHLGFHRGRGWVTHHKKIGEADNRLNNEPDNLENMTWDEHTELHKNQTWATTYNRSEKGKAKSRDLMNNLWANEEWAKKARERLSENRKKGTATQINAGAIGFQRVDKEILREHGKNQAKKYFGKVYPGQQEKAAAARKNKLEENPELKQRLIEKGREAIKIVHEKQRINGPTEKQVQARSLNAKKVNYIRWHAEKFATFEDYMEANKSPFNHKVVSVAENLIEEPVYDLINVSPTHNFAANGVFIHNSTYVNQYDNKGVYWPTTWNTEDGFISWMAFAAYADESYLVVDSLNKWKKKKAPIDLDALKKAVNEVSSVPVK